MAEDVDWLGYFGSIRTVCPWSLSYSLQGLIDIQTEFDPEPLGKYAARIYILRDRTNSWVRRKAAEMEQTRPQELWFFSYPGYGKNATPVRVLIQQDRNQLETIRKKLNNSVDDK